jgi:hypothetical protein
MLKEKYKLQLSEASALREILEFKILAKDVPSY